MPEEARGAVDRLAKAEHRVLVVFAHPDDAEFTCGGTLAKWTQEGSRIAYVVCTDGSKGGPDSSLSPAALTRLREEEQLAAARVLGVEEVTFLRYSDGELAPCAGLREELVREIRRFRPQRLLTWDPWRPYQLHSDHRAAGLAALEAVMAADNDRFFPEQMTQGLLPHRVEEVYLFGSDNADCWVDVAPTFGLKLEALRRHASQVGELGDLEERLAGWNRSLGEGHGFHYAEAFKVLRPHCEICR